MHWMAAYTSVPLIFSLGEPGEAASRYELGRAAGAADRVLAREAPEGAASDGLKPRTVSQSL